MKIIKMKPVGKVKDPGDFRSKIAVEKEFAKELEGIEEYSHIVILFWMHKVVKKNSGGAFATRIPSRPNPIGLTIVRLIQRKGLVLTVEGLDAWDGTPVLDIKPYTGHPKDLIYHFKSPDIF